jgi:hypothetical protein
VQNPRCLYDFAEEIMKHSSASIPLAENDRSPWPGKTSTRFHDNHQPMVWRKPANPGIGQSQIYGLLVAEECDAEELHRSSRRRRRGASSKLREIISHA